MELSVRKIHRSTKCHILGQEDFICSSKNISQQFIYCLVSPGSEDAACEACQSYLENHHESERQDEIEVDKAMHSVVMVYIWEITEQIFDMIEQ